MPPPGVYPRGCNGDQTTGGPAPGENQEEGSARDGDEAEDNPEERVIQLQKRFMKSR